jgi:hypothetical protein
MSHSISNVLSAEDVAFLNTLPAVLSARSNLESTPVVYFTIPLTDSIRSALKATFHLDLSSVSEIPMRWIQGDTHAHIDVGSSSFESTYLVYLTDSPGELRLGETSYGLTTNTGFMFPEGLSHETRNTGSVPRLLLGPMNEFAQPVGANIYYFISQSDALANTNSIANGGSYTIGVAISGNLQGITSWRIASNSTGSSSQSVVYTNGTTLNSGGTYFLYPNQPCFLEGSTILCQVNRLEEYIPIEKLTPGTLVKTSRDGYKRVVLLGKGEILNPDTDERIENRLYTCSTSKYPELKEDLYLTGCHSILVSQLTDAQREATKAQLGKLFSTDGKQRLMACLDERAEPWKSKGTYTIWHLALEHEDDGMNYGVYANGGLLVETCSIRSLKGKSNMTVTRGA